ncbi:hypothetical protein BDR26DRAFT_1007939 [Obelidium mucronatum]|nr:hypothetical protein BDR26DRAFT_1007939 [Obelidium mucronatum]
MSTARHPRLRVQASPLQINRIVLSNRLVLSVVSSQPPTALPNAITKSIAAIMQCFSNTRVNPSRLIYCLAGLLFYAWAPLPFGGPKASPGYASFTGATAYKLLQFIVNGSIAKYWEGRGRDALDLVVMSANKVLDLHSYGAKDVLDELLLKGMKKSGYISFYGAARIPPEFVHVHEEGAVEFGVEFRPIRRDLGRFP